MAMKVKRFTLFKYGFGDTFVNSSWTMILPSQISYFIFDMIEDGMDETLCPVDYAKAGVIVDDDVHDVLVRGLPKVCSQLRENNTGNFV